MRFKTTSFLWSEENQVGITFQDVSVFEGVRGNGKAYAAANNTAPPESLPGLAVALPSGLREKMETAYEQICSLFPIGTARTHTAYEILHH